jgi:hypothetical protein
MSISGQSTDGKIDSLVDTYYQNGVFNGVVLVSKKRTNNLQERTGTTEEAS